MGLCDQNSITLKRQYFNYNFCHSAIFFLLKLIIFPVLWHKKTLNSIIFCKCVATKKTACLVFFRNKSRWGVCATTSVTQSLPLLWPQDGGADGHKTGTVLLHASLPRCTGVTMQCARPVVESSGRGECISSGHKLVWWLTRLAGWRWWHIMPQAWVSQATLLERKERKRFVLRQCDRFASLKVKSHIRLEA